MKQIEMKCYGYLVTGKDEYALLSPAPFENEHYQSPNETSYFVAYGSVFCRLPHVLTVCGTYHIDWFDEPEMIDVEVPDNYEEKRSAPIQDFRPIDMIAEEDFRPIDMIAEEDLEPN